MSKIQSSLMKNIDDNEVQVIFQSLTDQRQKVCQKCAKNKTVCIADKLRKKYSEDRENAKDTDGFLRTAPVLPATIAPVTTQHATQKTPGTQAIPLAASNQNTIPSVVGPPVIPVQQLGVPAASSAPLSVPAALPAPRGPLNTPASNAMAALSAPAIPLQAVASPVPPTQPDQQGIPISIPAGLIPSSAPIQPAAGPPQTPQVAFAAPPETDNDPPMLEFQPPFENDYYGHNGSDPEKEDLWENVHFYGPGVYRLIDPLCPDLTKEQAQAAQKVWDTVQAYMRDIVQQGPEDLLN